MLELYRFKMVKLLEKERFQVKKINKILFTIILIIVLVTISSYTFAVNITSTNESVSNTTQTTGGSSKITVFELVSDKSCTMNLGDKGRFEKKVADFDATEKSITLQLSLVNTSAPSEVTKPSELFLVIDNSNSMVENSTEAGITRKEAVIEAASKLSETLLKAYPDLKIGVVSFSSKDGEEGTLADAKLEQGLTSDESQVKTALANIETSNGARTNIEAGLTIAEQNYTDEDNTKVLVLLSDGVPNNDAHGNFSTYSGDVATNTKAKLQELDNNGISILGAMIGLNGDDIEPTTQRTYQALAEEIFGTPEEPTVGKFYYIQDQEIEETLNNTIVDILIPTPDTKLQNVVIKDYFPQTIIDNFNFEYVASPNIGDVSTEIDKSDNSITWTIEVLNEDEVATLSYKLTLKDDFNKEILDEILPTNEKVDITYGEDGHVESDDSPTVRVKEEVPPQKEDNTTAQDPIPQTGNNSFIALAVIVSIAIVLAIVGIQIKKHNNK